MSAAFTFVDLFAGIGGFRQALASLGGTCAGFSEIAPDAIHAYCTNYKEEPAHNLGDITRIKDLPPHRFLTAGVPCQSWSIAGKNLGFDDDRGQLWNDTLCLLNKSRPDAFIFENVKGLADPRNKQALAYIMERIRQAGYFAEKYVLNASDYGVPQTRVRIYIVGFKQKEHFQKFRLPCPCPAIIRLSEVLDTHASRRESREPKQRKAGQSLSRNQRGFNDYFLFNDIRNGVTTIHSWDILPTTPRQKSICHLLLAHRRKSAYGSLDGNPLSLQQLRELDATITAQELAELVEAGILKEVCYLYRKLDTHGKPLTEEAELLLAHSEGTTLNVDKLKVVREFKMRKMNVPAILLQLCESGVVECVERRFDFKNTKISTGLYGVNRIFLPSSDIFPTLVASDTNDYVTDEHIDGDTPEEYKARFLERVYGPGNYRRITKSEACRIQGFPADFVLPDSRARWMKLIGNSVAVPVVRRLAEAVLRTGVFGPFEIPQEAGGHQPGGQRAVQLTLFD